MFRGTGNVNAISTGGIAVPALHFRGAGELDVAGGGRLGLPALRFAGAGTATPFGSGRLGLPPLAFSGAGTVEAPGGDIAIVETYSDVNTVPNQGGIQIVGGIDVPAGPHTVIAFLAVQGSSTGTDFDPITMALAGTPMSFVTASEPDRGGAGDPFFSALSRPQILVYEATGISGLTGATLGCGFSAPLQASSLAAIVLSDAGAIVGSAGLGTNLNALSAAGTLDTEQANTMALVYATVQGADTTPHAPFSGDWTELLDGVTGADAAEDHSFSLQSRFVSSDTPALDFGASWASSDGHSLLAVAVASA